MIECPHCGDEAFSPGMGIGRMTKGHICPKLPEFDEGDKVYFPGERNGYTVQRKGDRYAILTKPFNPRHTVIYTILDFEEGVRGTDNLVFSIGYEDDEHVQQSWDALTGGHMEVSYRNRVPLVIDRVTVN